MIRFLIVYIFVLFMTGCSEKPEKDTWYWMDDCWEDHLIYRSWKEDGVWKYEIYNNIDEDISLVYTVGVEGDMKEKTVLIDTGKSADIVTTDIKDTEIMYVNLVSVVAMKNNFPYKVITCSYE